MTRASLPGVTPGYTAVLVLPDGKRLDFIETAGGTFVPPTGRYDTLLRNPDGSFEFRYQRTRGGLRFASTGRLTEEFDEFGNRLLYTYDPNGRLLRVGDQAGSGRYLDVSYGADGRISAVADNSSRTVRYGYDIDGLLRSYTDAAGRIFSYSYQSTTTGLLLAAATDSHGRQLTAVGYGPDCHVQTLADAEGTFEYGNANHPDWPNSLQKWPASEAQLNKWRIIWNASGLITDRRRLYGWTEGGPTIHTDYRPDGLIEQVTDEVGVKTFYAYDASGRVTSVTRDHQGPLAIRFDYSYDSNFFDRVTAVTPRNPSNGLINRDWQEWQYDYHAPAATAPGALHHVYRIRSDGVRETLATYEYNSKGQVTRRTSASGGVTDYGYGPTANLITATAPANNDAGMRPVTAYAYDPLGRVTTVTDPLGKVSSYAYDALDRITSLTLPRPSSSSPLIFTTTYSYDNWDAPTGLTFTNVTDPNGVVTRQGYDQWGRLVRAVDAVGNATEYVWTDGVLTSIRDANGNVTTHLYEVLTRAIWTTTHPDGAPENYRYYPDASLQWHYSRSGTREYQYDRLKRLTYRATGFSTFETTTYAFSGQKLVRVEERDVPGVIQTHTYEYDASYRVTADTQAGRGTVRYTYTPDDSVATMGVDGGPTATYAYYPDGTLKTISWSPVSGQFRYDYTLPGQYQRLTFPNGQIRNFAYDDQGRLTQLSNLAAGGGNLGTYAYAYDLNHTTGAYDRLGQRVAMTATVPSQSLSNHLTKYEYDPLYQLKKVTYPGVAPFNGEVHTWTYDAIGNRLTNSVNGVAQTYAYQKIGANPLNWQRLLSDGVNSYTYDLSGDTVTRNGPGGNFGFGFNHDDRLISVSGAQVASYKYDHQGRRVSKTVSGATATMLYDGLNLVREAGAAAADYLSGSGIDEPLAMSRGGQIYYYAADGLGSPSLVTNASGTVQNKYLYDAWGVTRSSTTPVASPFTYTAREVGEASTLFYRARYYSPAVGRFLQEDSIRDEAFSAYAYVFNRPTSLFDPMGLAARAPTPRPTPKEPPNIKCTNCGPNEAAAQEAMRGVCAASKGGGCRAMLAKYGMDRCADAKCSGSVNISCVPEDCGGCGGPCNNIADPTQTIFLQPTAFTPLCGSLQDTVAHELAHMCGVGRDNCAGAACRENRLRANNVGGACSARP